MLRDAENAATAMPASRNRCNRRTVPGYASAPRSRSRSAKVSFFRLPSAQTVPCPGASSGVPHGSSIPRDARNAATPAYRSTPSRSRR